MKRTLLVVAMIVMGVQAEEVSVATSQELVTELTRLNGQGVANVIHLTADKYDLTGFVMREDAGTESHLFARYVTIKGRSSNPRDTVIYGDGAHRIFYTQTARLHDLTVSNGYANANYGPGVYASDSWSWCSNCVITCNVGDGINNGGVAWATCRDCEVCYNRSYHGGGVSFSPFWGGSIHDNEATASGGAGLGVSAHGTRVYNNKAAKGGAFCANSACTSEGCIIFNNQATSTTAGEGGGGAMCIAAQNSRFVVFTNCVFYGNTSAYGGAANSVTLIDCVVSNNVATYGGAFYNVHAMDTLVCSNAATGTSTSGGAALYGFFSGCVVSNNYAAGCAGAAESIVATNTVFACNRAVSNGGALRNSVVTNCTIVGNVSLTSGGGVYGGTLVGCRVLGNMSRPANGTTRVDGAGLYGVTASGCTIAGNACASTDGYGGGSWDSELRDCEIYNNYAPVGGALHGGLASDCVISNNVTKNGSYTIRCTERLEGCRLWVQNLEAPGAMLNCSVTGGGAAVTVAPGENAYTNGTFAADSVLIHNTQSPRVAATNCLFYGNRSWKLAEGPSNANNEWLRFVNCTFANNKVNAYVTDVPGSKNSSAEFRNCIFSGNKNYGGTADQDFAVGNAANDTQIYMSHCLFKVPPAAEWSCAEYSNILTNDARFVGAGDHPYSLQRSSPARRKGLVMDWMADATDIRGGENPRLCNGLVDLGCYEYWTAQTGLILFVR